MEEREFRRVYHISPWRRTFIWWLAGPMILGGVVCLPLPGEGLVLGGTLLGLGLAVGLFYHFMVSYARLIFTAEGVELRQMGYWLQAPWTQVAALRTQRAGEGLILAEPMISRGAARLSRMRHFSYQGAPMYDEEQRALLHEQRFIPIEAFAWHLRRGDMAARLRALAPQLAGDLAIYSQP